jgi:predicted cupin superfamily sugar epimerase
MHQDARRLIETLALLPHPEGGFFRETFRSPLQVETPWGMRAASTAIYFLLPAATFSTLHRVRSEEAWHHYDGDPLELHTIDAGGAHASVRLGPPSSGLVAQHVVAAGAWQAAVPVGDRYSLCGCTVAPGFDFADFEMAERSALLRAYPALRGAVERLTRARSP